MSKELKAYLVIFLLVLGGMGAIYVALERLSHDGETPEYNLSPSSPW